MIYQSDAGMGKPVSIDVRRPSRISFNEAFSPFLSALRSPPGSFYANQPHRANGNQRFPAILLSAGCQREMACIVYKALLLFRINKHLRGADREECCFSAVDTSGPAVAHVDWSTWEQVKKPPLCRVGHMLMKRYRENTLAAAASESAAEL